MYLIRSLSKASESIRLILYTKGTLHTHYIVYIVISMINKFTLRIGKE